MPRNLTPAALIVKTTGGMFASRTNWNLQRNRLAEALACYQASGEPLIDLSASNPTKCGFEYDSTAILGAFSNRASLVYEPEPHGLESARQSVANYYAERGDCIPIEDIFLTTSTSEAYSFVFRALCDAGDQILVPSPSYPLFEFLADIQDVKLRRYPLIYDYGWQIDFPAFERAISDRTRAVILVHPNNPTGHFCSQRETAKLNEICAAHDLALIADEVFYDFAVEDVQRRSFTANERTLTFTMSGISKICGLPQMKVAWLVTSGPAEQKANALVRLEMIADTYLSMNAPIQHALPAFWGQRNKFQRQLMDRVRRNMTELDRQLSKQELCARLQMQGGWYAVLRVPATHPDEDFAIELLSKHGVYVHPGHFYDFPNDGYLVVSLITPEEEFAEGIARLIAGCSQGLETA